MVVGNNYLAEYAEKAGARRVHVVPSVIDLDRYKTPTCSTSTSLAEPISGWLDRIAAECPLSRGASASIGSSLSREGTGIRFMIIGGEVPSIFCGLPVESRSLA